MKVISLYLQPYRIYVSFIDTLAWRVTRINSTILPYPLRCLDVIHICLNNQTYLWFAEKVSKKLYFHLSSAKIENNVHAQARQHSESIFHCGNQQTMIHHCGCIHFHWHKSAKILVLKCNVRVEFHRFKSKHYASIFKREIGVFPARMLNYKAPLETIYSFTVCL